MAGALQIDNAFKGFEPVHPLEYQYLLDGRLLDNQTLLRKANRNKTKYDSTDLFKPAYICSDDDNYKYLFMNPVELVSKNIRTLPRNRLTPHLMLPPPPPDLSFASVMLECRDAGVSDSGASAKKFIEEQNALIDSLKESIYKMRAHLKTRYAYMNGIDWCYSYLLYNTLVKKREEYCNSIDGGSGKYKKYITIMDGFPRTTDQVMLFSTYDDFMKGYLHYSIGDKVASLDPGVAS
jgi:hypothetical protein